MPKAIRPLFIPDELKLVIEKSFEFEWFGGMARSQRQKSVLSLLEKVGNSGFTKVLEISTYSPVPLGIKLSAFNLTFSSLNISDTVEVLYQKSKVFNEKNNIYTSENKSKGLKPVSFIFEKYKWPLDPLTCFYDWLYINALHQNFDLSNSILEYQAFTDIAYNPKKSLSTQARSAALYVALNNLGKLDQIKEPEEFIKLLKNYNYMTEVKKLF